MSKKSRCNFCNKLNKEKLLLSQDTWISKIQIRYIDNDKLLDELSVCPDCRLKHTIQELYVRSLFDKNKLRGN